MDREEALRLLKQLQDMSTQKQDMFSAVELHDLVALLSEHIDMRL